MRRAEREPQRTRWRRRRQVSTALLDPEDAAAIDLFREQEAEVAELRQSLIALRAQKAAPDLSSEAINRAASGPSVSELFERYANSGAANTKTVRKWRSRVAHLISYLGHDDAALVTRMPVTLTQTIGPARNGRVAIGCRGTTRIDGQPGEGRALKFHLFPLTELVGTAFAPRGNSKSVCFLRTSLAGSHCSRCSRDFGR